ncbi:hypothetical protein IT575_09395 [bacterium]|nr:hypothetical protein [bacterium]
MRRLRSRLRYLVLLLGVWLCWMLGTALNADGTTNHASTNAFLFLMGLSGVIALLSPSPGRPASRNARMFWPGPRVSANGVMHWR